MRRSVPGDVPDHVESGINEEVEHLADPRGKKRPSPREIMKPPSRLSSSTRIGTIPFILRTQEFYGKVMAHIDNATDAKEQVFNWFLPNSKAMGALLRNVGFEDLSRSQTVRGSSCASSYSGGTLTRLRPPPIARTCRLS